MDTRRNGRRYSLEFKQAVIATMASDALSANAAARRFGLNSSTVCRWRRQLEAHLGIGGPNTMPAGIDFAALRLDLDQLQNLIHVLDARLATLNNPTS